MGSEGGRDIINQLVEGEGGGGVLCSNFFIYEKQLLTSEPKDISDTFHN